ncbi:hypothetical protein X994_6617 (plasmid) [Burkholderia pseudomallei]|uniref:DUF192 domain-containing protein n=1 Tax=Burkholderia pseudomallei TaxID=28450 RepID=UPI00052A8968|nr:DUF192 domain-containing protein [Burkholderia pseudomallei]AIV73609.1 hypothetical protein X994_6617 [Burkholderia pseudomallei]
MNVRKAARNGVAGLIAAGLVLAFVVGRQQTRAATPTEVCTLHFSGGVTLADVPVAKTQEQQARGLMHRDDVGPGMLFSWPDAAERVFWMHNTPSPLSIGFFDAAGQLFAIKDMQPNSDEYHFSGQPAQDALELAQGQFQARGLAIGTRLVSRDCRPR